MKQLQQLQLDTKAVVETFSGRTKMLFKGFSPSKQIYCLITAARR